MAIAAAAAAERRRKLNREEEEMTAYRREDLEQGWEFKILRSASGAFQNPQTLASALAEEARGGWELLEKFDNERLRLRRPMAARNQDGDLPAGYDVYRTQHGISEGALVIYWVGGVIVVVALVVGLIAWANGGF